MAFTMTKRASLIVYYGNLTDCLGVFSVVEELIISYMGQALDLFLTLRHRLGAG